MKRLVVFAIVGPILGFLAVMFTSAMLGSKPDFTDPNEWAIGLFAGFLISAPSGLFDKLVAYFARPALRVPLTAACGAAVVAVVLSLKGTPTSNLPLAMLVFGLCMGTCSLLTNMNQGKTEM